jgi:putative transposase
MPHKSFRYRIYPTDKQAARLIEWSHALRALWNVAHRQRLNGVGEGLYRPKRRGPGAANERRYYSAYDQCKGLTALRAELPWLADVPRDVCGQLLVELDHAWQRCFKSIAAKPNWKCKGRDDIALCEPHPKMWRLTDNVLHFPKLGPMRVVVHRPLEGKPKTCALVRDGDQWFCVIACEIEVPTPPERTEPVVAIDRGVTNAIGDSDGRLVENPKFLAKQARRLGHAQRVVARRKKGSNNQKKARAKVMRLHRKVRRQRDHFLHVESHRYAKSHGTVIVEDLKVRNMTRSARGTVEAPGRNVRKKSGLNRGILDSGWGKLVQYLRYKLAWSGGRLVEVNPAYSSQTCAVCGHVAADNRKGEKFECVACGHQDHADLNAAKVLYSRGIHGDAVCGGSGELSRPAKQKLRPARGRRQGSSGRTPKPST